MEPGEANQSVKISGYLEKKGKLRMVWSWKKYWFVLKGRLLLYYRSKDEYDAISPCRGSINLGPPCTVKSCPSLGSCSFQIQTRANTITLRAETPVDQRRWMQSVMWALNQNQNFPPLGRGLLHSRYSLDDLVPCDLLETKPRRNLHQLQRQNTMPPKVRLSLPIMSCGIYDSDLYSNKVQPFYLEGRTLSAGDLDRKEENLYQEICNRPPKTVKKSKSFISRVLKLGKKTKEQQEPVVNSQNNNEETAAATTEQIYEEVKVEDVQKTPKKPTIRRQPSVLGETVAPPQSDPPPLLPPKSKPHRTTTEELTRSLEDILEDLQYPAQPPQEKNKVQQLIEKFDYPEVTLRKKPTTPNFSLTAPPNRHSSDELGYLLAELAKVTSAPVMSPGVTTSLITPRTLTQDDWLRLLPIKQRRRSEPDYDVPRSLHFECPRDESVEDVIPATRFFGPALTPSNDLEEENNKGEESMCVSMTPDSLETEPNYFYTSHKCNCGPETIYAQPKKSYVMTKIVGRCPNMYKAPLTSEHTTIYQKVRHIDPKSEVFKDSLELTNYY